MLGVKGEGAQTVLHRRFLTCYHKVGLNPTTGRIRHYPCDVSLIHEEHLSGLISSTRAGAPRHPWGKAAAVARGPTHVRCLHEYLDGESLSHLFVDSNLRDLSASSRL